MTDEERSALKSELKNEVLEEIKSGSNDITELDTVDTLDNVKSLPALQDETLVLAPISLLGKPATEAAETANAAAKVANAAAEKADDAADTAVHAASAANDAAESAQKVVSAAVVVSGTGEKSVTQDGNDNVASGDNSVAFGQSNTVSGKNSVALGQDNEATGSESIALGDDNTASGNNAIAEGHLTVASGSSSHSEGNSTESAGKYSHAEGLGTKAVGVASHAQGQYNVGNDDTLDEVGMGTSDTDRKNAEETKTDGKKYLVGVGGYDGTNAGADGVESVQEVIEGMESADEKALSGMTVRFDGFVSGTTISGQASRATTSVYYDTENKRFVYKTETGTMVTAWGDDTDLYMNADRTEILKDRCYLLDGTLYAWSEKEGTLAEAGGSGSGSGFYNVTQEQPLADGTYYTKDTAIAALADAKVKDEDKPGMIVTFEQSAGVWADYRFVGSSIDSFLLPASWEEYGGKIKSVSLNGTDITPDSNGNVALAIDQISVDESLDESSTNPVQNAVVASKINEISDAAVGGVEVISDDEKNTLNILNKKGTVIASAEFTGGGGSGTSTASRIVLTAALDKTQVKEGGTAELTYSYNHVNSDNEADGIKADITVTIQRGTTKTYEQTIKDVSAGTYTLDVSEYLLAGTMDIYVKAVATTAEGTQQTKQAYVSLQVITLTLTSSYNLGTNIAQGGYKNTDTIEIPFTITGSGTKDVSMYLDGGTTPTVQTINKSGTVNGSFTIQGSALTAGRHTVQLVAERSGLKSDSIFIDILKAGNDAAFVGVKYTDTDGTILTGDDITPTIKAAQYETMSFQYIAYDPDTTPATVEVWLNSKLSQTINAPRTMQTYTNRPTEQGTQTLELKIGSVSRTVSVNVVESSIDISEATYGLVAKLSAAGRSNGEADPAVWESGDIKTTFSGMDWSSNGWTGDALKLTNGAKAVIGYQPFKSDVKSTGLTVEVTMRVSNVMTRTAPVLSCIDGGKGILFTAEEASFKTGQSVTYTNEDDETVSREIKLGTNFVADEWIKAALVISTKDNNRLMELYINGNRTGADIYDTSFNFQQDDPQDIVISSEGADVEIRSIRIYNRAVSDDEELENRIVDAETSEEMMQLYDDNDILGDTGGVDIDKIRAKGKGVLRIVRANKLDDVYETNNKKTDFKADIYFYSPYGSDYDFVLKDCNIRIQGTSSTKYPAKNLRIYMAKGGESLSLTIGGVENPNGSNKYKMRPGAVAMDLFCCKADYSDSSMSLNTGGAKLFNDIFKELGLLTPPQQYQYEQGGDQTSAINIRTAIDGIPIDIFCAETEDGESEYYGQYNFNNEKSKSQTLFGQEGLDGYTPDCPLTLETLNNGEKLCLFQSESDDDVATNFDAGLETNYPDDVKWAGLTDAQKTALTRLFGWIRDCVPTGATADDLTTFVSSKFVSEIDDYFDKDFILTYYLWTDYFLSVDQRAKNMLLRTWDGLKWYITYYDGDTQLGKRNDCFLVYTYTTDRDTYDAEASKYAFEGRESWLWNLVLANLQDDLRDCAAKLRAVMTNERVLEMFNVEQAGHWSDRAFNKSGELKYIKPAVQEMYGKIWPFIYALQGSNTSHREYLVKNRFALLDAKYGTSNFTSDNIDMYLSRATSDEADVIKITANEVYAFGYGTNNSPNIANTGIIEGGETAELSISGAYTVNDPLRVYGASRIKVLNMTGAADHLKNGLDLGKCSVLQEINLQSSGSGSTGWWLVLSACRSLKKLDVRNQQQAKTGSSTSKEIDLSNNTKLEYLDARGTQVESVNFAQGAPVATAYLPSTIKTLRLEYLAQLSEDGLTLESWANVETLIFAGCPLLDWQTILGKCTGIKRLRVTGVDMEGDGTLLADLMETGGVAADGSYTDTCALVGTYRLTQYPTDEEMDAWKAHYPELNIKLPEYTMIEFDDTVSDDANVSNLDNKTGYKYGNDYVPSGHILQILKKRHRVLAKVTKKATTRSVTIAGTDTTMNNLDGEMTYCQLDDADSNKYADGTAAMLDGTEGDCMMLEPFYWSKGVNDYLNNKHYACYNGTNDAEHEPARPDATVLTLDDIKAADGGYLSNRKIMSGKESLSSSYTTDTAYSVCKVDVEGYKRVRFPTVPGTNLVGSVFTDADGNIVETVVVSTLGSKFEAGMYLIKDVPEGAVALHFTVMNTAEFDKVVLSKSDKIEDMEPEWIGSDAHLCGVFGSSVVGTKLRSCVTGGSTTGSMTWTDFHYYSVQRGMQQIDALMHSRIANLFYAKYGRRDSQAQCGAGQHSNMRTTGGTAGHGMTDTIGYDAASAISDKVTNSLVDENRVHQYAWYTGEDEYGNKTVTQVNNICCLGYEDIYGHKYDMMDGVDLPNDSGNAGKWRIWMPDGTTRMVKGTTTSGNWITGVAHGLYMDVVPVGNVSGSSSTYYCDTYWISTATSRVVYRGNSSAHANGGVSCAYAVNGASSSDSGVGSRLAFCGKIVEASSVEAYKALDEVA